MGPNEKRPRNRDLPCGGGRRLSRWGALALVLIGAGCSATNGPVPPSTEPGVTTSPAHMVAAANPLAAQAGREILRAGGSAVDAAIAIQLVLNLVEPQSSGIGGGAFLLHYSASDRSVEAFDGRETAPAAATAGMFLGPDGRRRRFYDAVPGGLSVGVPGIVAMLAMAHRAHGNLPWARLFAPAIWIAEQGFAISPRLHRFIARDRLLPSFPVAAQYFYTAPGAPKPAGSLLVNKSFAKTLRTIAREGANAFYRGALARDIVATVRGAPRNPGRLTREDLANYQAKKRHPLCRPYRIWIVCTMPPPTSGGIATLQILGLLERFDMSAVEPGSIEAVHLISEASRLAYADRDRYVADADFVPVPVEGLLDRGYLAARARLISPARSMGRARAGQPQRQAGWRPVAGHSPELPSTSHFSVVDASGNAVAMTTSIENLFGSRLMVGGFLLNNQLTDFSFRAERDGRLIANRAEPGKRPRSSMSPTLVLDRNRRLVMTLGSPGGARIIGYVARTLVATLDWGLGMTTAFGLANHVNRNGPTEIEKGTALEALVPALRARGHEVRVRRVSSGLHGIRVNNGTLEGGADPRREGVALGD